MARPRTFDPDDVLNIALDIFWRKGFRGTSLDDITAETGLTKPSLYAAFGDKNALFLKVLDRYHAEIVRRAEKALNRETSAREAIAGWLESFVPYCTGAKGSRGCLSLNAAANGALDEPEFMKNIDHYNAKLERLIYRRLHADREQFSKAFDPKAAAYFILLIYNGMMTAGRQRPTVAHVRSAIQSAISSLA